MRNWRIVKFWEGRAMVTCPVCEGTIDVDEEDVDEGDTISCDECGSDLKVVSTEPLEVESAEDEEEEEEEDDFLEEDEEEEEEEEEEDWK
jgi:alpha-aminoadipate/glutamate carrier protein LysW